LAIAAVACKIRPPHDLSPNAGRQSCGYLDKYLPITQSPERRAVIMMTQGEVDIRDTLILVRPERFYNFVGQETLVICGPTRGGTSVAAYVMLKLGYFLGDHLNQGNHEDLKILAAMNDRVLMTAIIANRNQRLNRWGFKIPEASHHAEWLAGALRNPIFLVVFRNPVAISKTILKRDPAVNSDLAGLAWTFQHGLRSMEAGTQVLMTEAPAILFDVDAARGTPELVIRDLASLFALSASEQTIEEIAREIRVGGYKSA
jgi:hypothetical protein